MGRPGLFQCFIWRLDGSDPTYLNEPILMIFYLFAAICCEPSYRVRDHFEPERVTPLYISPLYFIFNDTLLIIAPLVASSLPSSRSRQQPVLGSSPHYRYCCFAYKFGEPDGRGSETRRDVDGLFGAVRLYSYAKLLGLGIGIQKSEVV